VQSKFIKISIEFDVYTHGTYAAILGKLNFMLNLSTIIISQLNKLLGLRFVTTLNILKYKDLTCLL